MWQKYKRLLIVMPPFVWLLVLFLAPFLIVFKISLSDPAIAIPPYVPTWDWTALINDGAAWSEVLSQFWYELDMENYWWITEDDLYWKSYLSSIQFAFVSTLLCLLIGYPMAYYIARSRPSVRPVLLILVILPFWTSFLIRVYAWIGILKTEGLLNLVLQGVGLIDQPLMVLNTNIAVYIGLVYSYLPFMILPLYATLEKMDDSLLEAAQDLGCTPIKTFWRITIPLSLPGMIAGSFLVFIPSIGEFVIPELLGGAETLMIGKVLWTEFFGNRDWPVASAVAVLLLLVLLIPIIAFQHIQHTRQEAQA